MNGRDAVQAAFDRQHTSHDGEPAPETPEVLADDDESVAYYGD